MKKQPTLIIENIRKTFGKKLVLDGITFDMSEGEVIALLGPSGCGKSTLLFLIAGLEKSDSGNVFWQGINLDGIPSYRRGFGLMFQDYALFPHMDVFRNVAFGLRMSGYEQEAIRIRVGEVLDLVDLNGFEHREISTLSGGEAQRVALARALAPRPSLLMLDEPLGSIDRTLKERVLTELSRILRQLKQTAIYVTHDQEEAFTISDRVVLLNKGQVEQIGPPQEIYSRPSSRFVAEFLGLTNLLPGFVEEISGNTFIATPLGDFSFVTAYRGNVTVLIHPEGMSLGSENNFQLAGKLIESTFRGNICRMTVKISNELLSFDFLSNTALPRRGDPIYLNFDPDRSLHLFPEPFHAHNQ